MEFIKDLDSTVEKTMSPFKKTAYLKAALHLILVLYAAKLAPSLPPQVLSLFENQYFKLFVFSLILWTAQFSPSTSILISIAFMVSMNAVNKKPLWEFLENVVYEEQKKDGTVTVTPQQSVEAVNVLAKAAASPEAISTNTVSNVANIAAANVTTQEGAEALKKLAEQAITPAPAPQQVVAQAAKEVVTSISAPAPVPAPGPVPAQVHDFVSAPAPAPVPAPVPAPKVEQKPTETPKVKESIEAVKLLAQAAISPEASSPQVVTNVANVAAANITKPEAKDTLNLLVKEAVTPGPAKPEVISEAVKQIVSAMPEGEQPIVGAPVAPVAQKVAVSEPAPTEGCFPIRRFDISKVEYSTTTTKSSNPVFEDYAEWVPPKK